MTTKTPKIHQSKPIKVEKAKKIYMTDKLLNEHVRRAYEMGEIAGRKKSSTEIAELLGLYEIFETKHEEE